MFRFRRSHDATQPVNRRAILHVAGRNDGQAPGFATVLPVGESVDPTVFPIRNASRPSAGLAMGAGCCRIDTFTPLNRNARSCPGGLPKGARES